MGEIRNILKEITDPMSGYSIMELGIIEKVITKGKDVIVRVNLPHYGHLVKDYIIAEIKAGLIALPNVRKVIVEMSNKVMKYPFI